MKHRSAHESEADAMGAVDVWGDAQQIAQVLQQNLRKAEPVVWLHVPLSSSLAALDNLSEEEMAKLKEMYKKCPELKTCHRLKEGFRKIFEEETSRTKAKARLQAWKKRTRKTGLKSLEGFLTTLDNWEEWILNYFSSGKITNGVVEGLNNKIKVIKRRGYGYRNNGNFKQRILVECGC